VTGDPRAGLPAGPFGAALRGLAVGFALAGALVLAAMALMSTASILGRWLFARPIPGDYELSQLGTAIAVAAFLPYCTLRGGHVLVDFLAARAPERLRAALDAAGSAAIAAVGFLVAWRLALGMADLRLYGETTMVLAIPTWYAYLPMVPSFALLGVVALARAGSLAGAAFTASRESG
jgi:TRAP-type C4-dicarboxylate transport system permease small subunit